MSRSTMVRMRLTGHRTVLMSIALVGVALLAGAFLERLSFPRVAQMFNICASSKQFLVEFRTEQDRPFGSAIPGVKLIPVGSVEMLEVDGVKLGEVGRAIPLRHFLCEGNHTATVVRRDYENRDQTHKVDFAVSRASLFYVTKEWLSREDVSTTCISGQFCGENIFFELSAYEPDDPKARIYPQEAER